MKKILVLMLSLTAVYAQSISVHDCRVSRCSNHSHTWQHFPEYPSGVVHELNALVDVIDYMYTILPYEEYVKNLEDLKFKTQDTIDSYVTLGPLSQSLRKDIDELQKILDSMDEFIKKYRGVEAFSQRIRSIKILAKKLKKLTQI